MNTYIFTYHALDSDSVPFVTSHDAADRSVVVRLDEFKKQLRWLRESQKRIVPLTDVLDESSEDAANHKDDRVVLTFDDGHKSNFTLAMPALLEANCTATFYVVAGLVDNDPEYVTSDQLREMAAQNMHIGSHTMTHRWLPLLSPKEVRRELSDSKARLEDILSQPVLDFALPGGHYNRPVLEALRESDYRSVATSRVGVHRVGGDPQRLRRIEIRRYQSMQNFRSVFRPSTILKLKILAAGKTCLRRVCGLRFYTRLRSAAYRPLQIE